MKLLLLSLFALILIPQPAISQYKPYKPYQPYENIYKPYTPYLSYEKQAKLEIKFLKKLAEFIKTEHAELVQKDSMLSEYSQQMSSLSSSSSDLNKFLYALAKQESGGNYYKRNRYSGAYGKYQFMPTTWKKWAKLYSKQTNLPLQETISQTPLNQERVTRFKAKTIFNWYGNWQDVASFWYSGRPYSQVVRERWVNKRQYGGPSVRQYVKNIINQMNKI